MKAIKVCLVGLLVVGSLAVAPSMQARDKKGCAGYPCPSKKEDPQKAYKSLYAEYTQLEQDVNKHLDTHPHCKWGCKSKGMCDDGHILMNRIKAGGELADKWEDIAEKAATGTSLKQLEKPFDGLEDKFEHLEKRFRRLKKMLMLWILSANLERHVVNLEETTM